MPGFTPAQRQHYENGPFPERIDLWAEDAHFFHAIHGRMISALLEQNRDALLNLGYVAGTETTLQIAEGRIPDIFVKQIDKSSITPTYNYAVAAAQVLAEPGERIADLPELDALHIRDAETGELVTVVEIVSPGNKTKPGEIFAYQERRSRLFLEKGVNVVEIDATRSLKRLVMNTVTEAFPYHIAIFLPGDAGRIVGIALDKPLSRIALPLRREVLAVEVHHAYAHAYRQLTMAWHIQTENRYTEDALPFVSLLSNEQRTEALARVKTWQTQLENLLNTNGIL